jgi:hypothetical protein
MPQPTSEAMVVQVQRIRCLVDDLSKEGGRTAMTEAMVKQINTDLTALCAAIPLDPTPKP